MKKILLTLMAAVASISISAQTVKVYENDVLVDEYYNTSTNTVKVVCMEEDDNMIPGEFSVSATKKVYFTKGNLYWDGSAFCLEANQTDYLAEWNVNHVGYFPWVNITDYNSGNASYKPYAESYAYSSRSSSDTFWCGVDNPLTINGTNGLYALTATEWDYLIKSRANCASLHKYGVTVTNGTKTYSNCLIVAPDSYDYATTSLKSEYTLDELNNLGLLCLPASGYHYFANQYFSSHYPDTETQGYQWSASPSTNTSGDDAYFARSIVYYSNEEVATVSHAARVFAYPIRLVRTAK